MKGMRLKCGAVLVIASVALMLIIVPQDVEAPGPWNTEVVVSAGNVGWFPSMVIDSENSIHIAYVDGTDLALKMAHQNGTGWDIETIEGGIIPAYVNLLLDDAGNMHLAYYDRTNKVVKYAMRDEGSWHIEIADSYVFCETQELLFMDLDSMGYPHLAYCHKPGTWNNTLIYTNKTGGTWESQVVEWVDGNGFHSPGISISIDSDNRPFVMWGGIGNLSGIHFLAWNEGSWNDEIVHDDSWGTHPEEYPFMTLDSSDVPRMSFGQVGSPYDGNMDLRYASRSDSSWVFETPDVGTLSPTGEVGWFSRFAFDSFDRPHITYREGGGGFPSDDLFYAHWTGFSWDVEVVDSGITFYWASVGVDHCNMPHIAYLELSDGFEDANLKHAWKSCPAPMPDLTLARNDISFDPPSPVENGTSVRINATIHNIGMTNVTNVTVRFYKGTPHPLRQIGSDMIIPFIRHGLSETTGITWTARPEGTHDICVVVDPDYQIDEINELNNQACTKIEVYTPQAPGPPNMLTAYLSGEGFENVTIEWSLSPDDLGGSGNVERYDVLRGETYDSSLTGYSLLDSVPSGVSSYVDSYAGEGDLSNYFYVACAVNAIGNQSCAGNQVGKFTRPLTQGPNLVSIPLIQSDGSIETVLQTVEYDKAWYYDSSSGEWRWFMKHKGYRRGLWKMNHTMGIWVNATHDSNLTVAGVVPAQTTIHLATGWNLVGFPSFNATYMVADLKVAAPVERVEAFEPSSPPHLLRIAPDAEMLLAGYGYWVRVEADADWVVKMS